MTGPEPFTGLRFQLLGPLRAWRGTTELDLGQMQQRVVLAVLLLHADSPVGRDQLVDAVWGWAVPARAANLLQRHVSGLRRVLEPDRPPRAPSGLLAWTEASYLLTPGPAQLDVRTFDGLIEQAHTARAEGDRAKTSEALHAALDLWHGQALRGPDRTVGRRRARPARGAPPERPGGTHRGRPVPRRRLRPRGRDTPAHRRASAAGGLPRSAHAGPAPCRTAGGGAGGLPPRPPPAARRTRHRAGTAAAPSAREDPGRRPGARHRCGQPPRADRGTGGPRAPRHGRHRPADDRRPRPTPASRRRFRRPGGGDRPARLLPARRGRGSGTGWRRRDGRHHGDRRHGRGRQDHPGRALGPPGPRPVPRRTALRQFARLRPERHCHAPRRGDPGIPGRARCLKRNASRSIHRDRSASTGACWRTAACWSCWTTPRTPIRYARCCPARRTASASSPAAACSPVWSSPRGPSRSASA